MRRVATVTSRGVFAALWARLWFERQTQSEETALATYSPITRDMATIRDEVDLCTPDMNRWHLEAVAQKVHRPVAAAAALSFALIGGAAIATAISMGSNDNPRCTFADGSSVAGKCMFEENFATLDSAVWLVENEMVSALLEHAAPWGCVREENVSVSGGVLKLRMSDNVRGSCPQGWTSNAAYTTITGGAFPAPTGTSFDTASISMRSFKWKYGHFYVRAKMSGGTSPWAAVLLWGENCQSGGAMRSLMEGIFTQTGICNWPADGSYEWDAPSYVHSQNGDGRQAIFAFHRNSGSSAPFLRNFYGTIPYYGIEFAPNIVGYEPYLTSLDFGDLSTAFHIYEFSWKPRSFEFKIDGTTVAGKTADYVAGGKLFAQFWNVDNAGVAVGLPQDFEVDYFRLVCEPGDPCEWTGAGAL